MSKQCVYDRKTSTYVLLACALPFYLLLAGINLTEFPFYFFCDEAIHGVEASAILENGTDSHGVPWPIFFKGLGEYNIGLSVYLQIPLTFLFGMTEFAVRIRSVIAGLFAVVGIFFLLRSQTRSSMSFATFALFLASPTWFLHTRTGFEVIQASSLYLLFMVFYFLSFKRSPITWAIVPTAFCAAGAFYSYLPTRGWIILVTFLLAVVNFKVHIAQYRKTLIGLVIGLVLLMPAAQFYWHAPSESLTRLYSVGFSRFQEKSPFEQVRHISKNYALSLSPHFWFSADWEYYAKKNPRHFIPGKTPLPLWLLPFSLIGIIAALCTPKSLLSRTLVVFFISPPFPSVLVDYTYLRTFGVGVMYIVFGSLGFCVVANGLIKYAKNHTLIHRGEGILLIVLAIITACKTVPLTQNGKFLYSNYGFWGLQSYGHKVYKWFATHEDQYKKAGIHHVLFNAEPTLRNFYLWGTPVQDKVIGGEMHHLCERPEQSLPLVWATTTEEFRALAKSPCPLQLEELEVILDPHKEPVITIFRAKYEKDFHTWYQKEEAKRNMPKTVSLSSLMGNVKVTHPRVDWGSIQHLLDGNPKTDLSFYKKNPARITLTLDSTQSLSRVSVTLSNTTNAEVSVDSFYQQSSHAWGKKIFSSDKAEAPRLEFFVDKSMKVDSLVIFLFVPDRGPEANPHIGEISWD